MKEALVSHLLPVTCLPRLQSAMSLQAVGVVLCVQGFWERLGGSGGRGSCPDCV